jgi:hypothetical protein
MDLGWKHSMADDHHYLIVVGLINDRSRKVRNLLSPDCSFGDRTGTNLGQELLRGWKGR